MQQCVIKNFFLRYTSFHTERYYILVIQQYCLWKIYWVAQILFSHSGQNFTITYIISTETYLSCSCKYLFCAITSLDMSAKSFCAYFTQEIKEIYIPQTLFIQLTYFVVFLHFCKVVRFKSFFWRWIAVIGRVYLSPFKFWL